MWLRNIYLRETFISQEYDKGNLADFGFNRINLHPHVRRGEVSQDETFYYRKTSVTPKPAIIIKAGGRAIPVAMVCPNEKLARGMPFSKDLHDELGIDRGRRSIK